jgi:hypothetical protein
MNDGCIRDGEKKALFWARRKGKSSSISLCSSKLQRVESQEQNENGVLHFFQL